MGFYRKKSKIWELFTKADIHSLIAPFGFSTPYHNFDFSTTCKLICQPKYLYKSKDYNVEVHTNPRIHAKLAVGFKGMLIGSFNFSNTKQKELVWFSNKPKDIEDALCEFDYWWDITPKGRELYEFC